MFTLSLFCRAPRVGPAPGHYRNPPGPGNRRAAGGVPSARLRARRLGRSAAGMLAAALVVACGPAPVPEWTEAGQGVAWRPLQDAGSRPAGFRSRDRTGIDFMNRLSAAAAVENDHLLIGSGVTLGDADGDGRTDVYLTALEGPNRLFMNRGNWDFAEATEAGVALDDRHSTGAVFADVDGDGDLDLVVTALGDPNALLLNDGTGRFIDATEARGLDGPGGSTTSTLADVDGDGDLDLYVAQYKSVSAADELLPFERQLSLTVGQGDDVRIAPPYREHFRLERRGDVLIPVERAEPDRLYLNDGSGSFSLVTAADGRFRDAEGGPLEEMPDDFGLAARFYDVDSDGDPDLYVCNDFDHADHFWLNDGTGVFTATDWRVLRTTSYASMAVDFADVDRDGHVDFFVADMRAADRERLQRQRPLHRLLPKRPGEYRDRIQFQRNTLQMNRGDGTFAQVSEMAGVDASEWTWASAFLDVDLDGWEDLLVSNGHGRDMQDADALNEIARLQGRISWDDAKQMYPDLETPNVAFRNRGDGTFEEVGAEWGWGAEPDVSHGIAYGDLDRDGDLDVVVNRLGRPARVLENTASASRVAVSLVGSGANTRGIGAVVTVRAPGLPEQSREMTAGGIYLSGSEPLLSFAAGEGPVEVRVRWPSGRVSVVEDARPAREYRIAESGAGPDGSPEASGDTGARSAAAPLFEDVSGALGHTHTESDFDEARLQPLLPSWLSQQGPGVSWVRVPGADGPLLVLPSGAGGRLSVHRWTGDAFRQTASVPATADQITGLVLSSPAGPRLYVARSGYELRPEVRSSGPAVVSFPLGADGTLGARTNAVPGADAAQGPLATADVDGDGDLDLFVTGRVVPGAYPRPAPSRLLLRTPQGFIPDPANRALMDAVGPVSAATFSDLDADGDPDLVLAEDPGLIRVLFNEGGRFTDRTTELDLGAWSARWNGVTTGDLNEDGLPDIVATSWGLNLQHRPEDGRPLRMFYGDFDRNGTVDILEAQADSVGGDPFPTARLEWLQPTWPQLRLRFPSYRLYATASVADVTRRAIDELAEVRLTTTEHRVFLSGPNGYRSRPLPALAQRAPALHAGIADLDGDGHEDLLLTQNVFATPTHSPRHDAGRGLLLLGDGSGRLTPVPGHLSGIVAWGEQRGAAFSDFDADGRTDLVIAQNASETKVFLNRTGRPGLRVRLEGPPANPWGYGAAVRVVYADGVGPWREIRAGSGWGSADDPVVVLGLRADPTAVRVRWPGGRTNESAVSAGDRELVVRAGAGPGR